MSKYLFFLFALIATSVFGQAPFIKSVSKDFARPQEIISIQGINFGTNASNIRVTFGGASVIPQTITDQFIEVAVPYGAVYDDISVTNISTGLKGSFKNSFLLSYGGSNPFNVSQLSSQANFDSESDLYDLTIADFDGDGKLDVATANKNSTSISFFLNTSTPGTASFTKTLLTPGVNTLHVSSGDLNGDGKPEIIATENNGPRIYIFKNNSTAGSPSFVLQNITAAGAKVSQVRVVDLDLNGHPDLVLTDQSSSRIFIAANQSTLATISFPAVSPIALTGTAAVDGIAVGDLDGDGLHEIAVSEFLTPTGNIFILKNKSVPGTMNFASPIKLTQSTPISNLYIGDLDGDSKSELAATAFLGSSVLVFGNQSTSTTIKFDNNPAEILASAKPWGLDFGDLDGDGKTDIAVASITQKVLTILNNKSTAGHFAFNTLTIPTTYITRHLKIGDIDNDGRPDLNFTSVDDVGVPASKISVFRNLNCITPMVDPPGPMQICDSFTQRLTASSSPGSTYEWFKSSVSLGAPTTTPYIDVNVTGTYKVQVVNGSCTTTSAVVPVTVISGATGSVTPSPVPPVCIGGTLTLSVNDVGASDYVWTGPGSYIGHGKSVDITNFQASQAGEYFVEVKAGPCTAQRASIVVDVVDVPNVEVLFTGSDVICEGQTKAYSIYPSVSGYSYQWAEQTSGNIAGEINSTFTATASGNYYVKLKSTLNATCPIIQSSSKKVRITKVPVVDFTMPSTACTNQPVSFASQSTLDSDTVGLRTRYVWDFGDAGAGSGVNPTHTYTSAQSYNVTLYVSYINQSCPASKMKSLAVQNLPVLAITNPSNLYGFCKSDSILLQVAGTFDTYLWSNGNTTPFIYAKDAGTFAVEVTLGSCKVSTTKDVTQFTVDLQAVATPNAIKKGDSTHLSAVGTSLINYLWRPNKIGLPDSLIANPIAKPLVTTSYTVSGKDVNGCGAEASVTVVVSEGSTFILSPDDNNQVNDKWEVVADGQRCSVTIYDERGVKVFEASPYHNDWKGISTNGHLLPAGAYYYVMRCDNSSSGYTAGCINIIR